MEISYVIDKYFQVSIKTTSQRNIELPLIGLSLSEQHRELVAPHYYNKSKESSLRNSSNA